MFVGWAIASDLCSRMGRPQCTNPV